MKTSTATAIAVLLSLAAAAYAMYMNRLLPAQIPTHWNIQGKPDAWGPKGATLYLMPGMMLAMSCLIYLLPWLSPQKFKIDVFRATFNYIMVLVNLMMGYLHVVILQNTLHPDWNATKLLFCGIMISIGLIGNLLGKVKQNFYVGIRTPWTIASAKVWTATHRLGGRLMFGAGFIGAILIAVGAPVMPVFILFIAATLFPVLYSFILYKRLERAQAL